MPNQNGRNHPRVEHGYQDPRDQRDREQGRDDFRGLDGDRHTSGNRGSSQGDQYAERDRNMYGDRGSGYSDGLTYRGGQSGTQAGGRDGANAPWQGQGVRGGSEGHWGDMDQGGRSGYDMQRRGPHAGKGPQGFQRSDERIKEMVHEALTDHGDVDATNIIVNVVDGEVTLTGTVEDRQTKRLAEDAIERVTGVKDVHNQLRIVDARKRPS